MGQKKCLKQQLGRQICRGSALDCGSRNKSTVKIGAHTDWQHGGCGREFQPWNSWFDFLEEQIIFSLVATKLVNKNSRGGGSQDHVQLASADSCRTRGIEGVQTVELVFVGRLLWMADVLC